MESLTIRNRKPLPPPSWLDRATLREAMFKRVNYFSGGTWQSVSMNNGLVWFRYNALLACLVEASGHAPDVLALAVDKKAQNDLLFSVLKALNDDCVAWNMIGEGYTAIRCSITNKSGLTTGTAFLTPIKVSWFNAKTSWLERLKTTRLRYAVNKIEIFRG